MNKYIEKQSELIIHAQQKYNMNVDKKPPTEMIKGSRKTLRRVRKFPKSS